MGPLLSIIIPAYDEEERLPSTIQKILDFIDRQDFDVELLVIDNGSRDRTAAIVREAAREHSNVFLYQEATAGKGLAVRRGMLQAIGEFRFICDADLSMPIDEVLKFLPPRLENIDIAIGSREAPGAVRHDEPLYRHWVGRAFNALVGLIAVRGFKDTQCGFKCFRAAVADDLFGVQQLDGWTFDVEVLFIALKRGYSVVEVPINWYFFPSSRIRVFRDSINMFLDLFRIRRNWQEKKYIRQDR
ncbi:MAG: glycosyltransferase family 2 protein [Chloroflexi bacterium]|nr:glycosyltransferase family 2 protein [Chloroflexota bacterium]